jgi:periodic tryptophan protein 1
LDDKVDEDEELDEMMVAPTDNLILTAKTEDEVSHIEVYLYEEDEDNLFVHHDLMLPSFPLCMEWISVPLGRKAGVESKGSYVAVGTFDPEIEIWDLDVIDPAYPEVILGGGPSTEALGTGKKKKRSKKPSPDYHVDAVMCLAANRAHPTLLASGSADMTVKLWDITQPAKALRSFSAHKNKVQACAWNRVETTVLLTGGYDKKACVFDTRMPEQVLSFSLTADVETLRWDPFQAERFYVSTEDGLVKAFDARMAAAASQSTQPLFTIHAHDAPVSALDLSPTVPGLMVTGSADKTVKVWSIPTGSSASAPSSSSGKQVRCLATRDLQVGKVFAAQFSPDSGGLVAVAGGKGNMVLWSVDSNAAVRNAFPEAFGTGKARKEVVALEDDNEDDSDDEKAGQMEMVGGGADMDMDDEEGWEED